MRKTDIVVIAVALVYLGISTIHEFNSPGPARRPLPAPSPVAVRKPATDAPSSPRRPPPAVEPPPIVAQPQSPTRPAPEPAAADDPIFDFGGPIARTSGSGTAFAVSSTGAWMTARHVTHDCAELTIYTPRARQDGRLMFAHRSADVSLIDTAQSGPALQLGRGTPAIGTDGYSFGFPNGQMGGAHTQLIGRMRGRYTGGWNGLMPVLAWAEVERYPQDLPAFSGMSGGPVFDADGQVVGIHVSTETRRGRLIAIAPEVLREVSAQTPSISPGGSPLTEVSLPKVSLKSVVEGLYRNRQIAYVYCTVPKPTDY